MAKRISSRNQAFQHLEVVKRNRSKRTHAGEAVVEGVIPIDLCMKRRIRLVAVFFAYGTTLSDWAGTVIADARDAEVYEVDPDLLGELSDRDEPSELIVIAEQPRADPDGLALDRIVILDRPVSPGNLGTTLRSCEAFGIDAVLVCGHGADPFDPKAIAASRGAVFTVPIVTALSNAALQRLLERARGGGEYAVLGSSARGGLSVHDLAPRKRFALIIGNETTGMAHHLSEICDAIVRIPIGGDVSSLNVSCAASILLCALTAPQ